MDTRRDVTFEDCVEVALEIRALDEYRKLIPSVLRPASDMSAFLDPLLDAIAIHSRALIDFFYERPGDRGRHRDDLCAADFVRDWHRQIPTRLAAHRQKLDKHLAHITRQRSGDRDDGTIIEVGPVADDIIQVAEDFAEQVFEWRIMPGSWTVQERSGPESYQR